jgi:hypothetical protein
VFAQKLLSIVIVRCKVRRGSLHVSPAGLKVRGVGLNLLGASSNADVRIWIATVTPQDL